jgi:DNA-directed RNA polymerase subunit K/omega
VIHRPSLMNPFEFVQVASLRAAQLTRGCQARVPVSHRSILTAQLEVAEGKVSAAARDKSAIDPAHSPTR